MLKRIAVLELFMVAFTMLSGNVLGQAVSSKTGLSDWKKYDIIQYVTVASYSPQQIMQLDNNGEILLACLMGKTPEELAMRGITYTKSQLKLLEVIRVLRDDDGVLKTVIPLLDSLQTARLREITHKAAVSVAEHIRPDVIALTAELERINRERNAFSIVFSYVLDGQVWDCFEEMKLLEPRVITIESPFWAGTVWGVTPARAFCPGTNSISDKGISLCVTWSEEAIPKMLPFIQQISELATLTDDYIREGKATDTAARRVFEPYDLFDKTGRMTVPIIVEASDNRLYAVSRQISQDIAAEVPKVLSLTELVKEFRFVDEKEALVVAYHELMWDILDRLETDRLLRRPSAFSRTEAATPKDIADQVFMVRKIGAQTDK